MKKLNITTGCNYKVTNKQTKQVHILNAQEAADFAFKNDFKNYKFEEVKQGILYNIPEIALWCMLFVLTFASFALHLKLNY